MALLCRFILLLAVAVAAYSFGMVFTQYTVLVVMAGVLAVARARRWKGSGTSHGTARLANFNDLLRGNLLGSRGLYIGRSTLCDPPSRWHALSGLLNPCVSSARACRMFIAAFWLRYDNNVIRASDYVHAITFAPTGAGKGVSQQIPTLLSHPDSMVVIDPQGTLFTETWRHRQDVFGHKIIRLDPHGVVGPMSTSDGLNPCDFLDANAHTFVEDIRSMAELCVKREEKEFQPHFNDWAISILATMMTFVCACEADVARRNLISVRDLVASRVKYTEAVEIMKPLPGVIGKLGHMLTWLIDKELASILSSVHRHTAWMDSPPIAACLSRSTFDPRWLRSGKVTVYLILPSSKLSVLSPLLRLWLGTIMQVLSRDGASQKSERNEIMFMLDEAAHLGKIQILEDAITLMRAYGFRIWLFMQSVNQLQKCYGENAQTILDNMGTQIFFGTNAYESADHISKRIGDCTILVESINRNWNRSRSYGQSTGPTQGSTGSGDGTTISEAGRRLLRPEEILILPRGTFIAFHRNNVPIAGELIRWYEAPEFQNHRSGQSRGLGLGAVLIAAAFLLSSLSIAVFVGSLPGSAEIKRMAFGPAVRRDAFEGMDSPYAPLPYQRRSYGQPVYRQYPYQQHPIFDDGFSFYDPSTWGY